MPTAAQIPNEDDSVTAAMKAYRNSIPYTSPIIPKEPTFEERLTRAKENLNFRDKLNRMSGVSSDPYADVKARLDRQEAEHAKNRENEGFERFVAFASGMVNADPTKGLGAGMAGGASAVSALKGKQAALKDSYDNAAIASAKELAKAQDARATGDRDSMLSAETAYQTHQREMATLQNSINKTNIDIGTGAINAGTLAINAKKEAREADEFKKTQEQNAKQFELNYNIKKLELLASNRRAAAAELAAGKPPAEVALIENYAKSANIPFDEAYKRMEQQKYEPRSELANAKEKDKFWLDPANRISIINDYKKSHPKNKDVTNEQIRQWYINPPQYTFKDGKLVDQYGNPPPTK